MRHIVAVSRDRECVATGHQSENRDAKSSKAVSGAAGNSTERTMGSGAFISA
jgi:hypothetical protein